MPGRHPLRPRVEAEAPAQPAHKLARMRSSRGRTKPCRRKLSWMSVIRSPRYESCEDRRFHSAATTHVGTSGRPADSPLRSPRDRRRFWPANCGSGPPKQEWICKASGSTHPVATTSPVPTSTFMDIASITALVEDQLSKATTADSGRSSVTVYGRSGARLRQTVIALAAGRVLGEHKSPGDASVYCLHGHVRLHAGDLQAELRAGDFVAVPPQRHNLEALEPSVLLFTVALH
jgi:quercetin dioxygenase-like cupin family protein